MRPHYVAALLLYPLASIWAQSTDKPAAAPNPAELEAVVETDMGTIRMEFLPDKAPNHVEQFIRLSKEGYYDNSGFFRVGPGHIDGGDPNIKDPKAERKTWGTGGMDMLKPEFNDTEFERGVVATFHAFKHGDGAQFFILVSNQPLLNKAFTAFARVTAGLDVVDKISKAPAAENGITNEPVRIKKITIQKKTTSASSMSADGSKKAAVKE